MLYVNPAQNGHAVRPGLSPAAGKRQAALEEFEHYFLFTLLEEMRKSVPNDGLFPRGAAGQMFDEMLDDALAGVMAKSGQVGLADAIDKQLELGAAQHALRGRWRSGALQPAASNADKPDRTAGMAASSAPAAGR